MYDKAISMSKGVAIILMVLAHTKFADYGDAFIGMFHMPLFFFVSGYCFKEGYLENFRGYARKRISGAYWPFVKWGVVFLLLHNFFCILDLYNVQFGSPGDTQYSLMDFVKRGCFIIFSMNKAESLLGGYWFLHTYFCAAFIMFATILMLRKYGNKGIVMGGRFCW